MNRHPEWNNLAARLENYKAMHKALAKRRNLLEQFLAAPTLTQARKILWGEKKKRNAD